MKPWHAHDLQMAITAAAFNRGTFVCDLSAQRPRLGSYSWLAAARKPSASLPTID